MSELLWVAVPGGISESGERREAILQVVVVPRLDGPSLASEGMDHWPPATLMSRTLDVEFAPTIDGKRQIIAVAPSIQAQPDLWEAFFGPNTVIRPSAMRGQVMPEVQVRGNAETAAAVQATFAAASRAEVSPETNEQAEFNRVVRQELETRWSGPDPLHTPGQGRAQAIVEPPDFNRTIAMLREHPTVLRALGLIFDIGLADSAVPAGGLVRVSIRGGTPLGFPECVSPWTRYDARFRPAAAGQTLRSGMVALDEPLDPDNPTGTRRWQIATFDVDAGAGRLRDAARAVNAGAASSDGAAMGGVRVTLPALRSAGLILMRRGRQADFAERQQASAANAMRAPLHDAVLNAEDLVLGYRLDVKPEDQNDWFSLHQRTARYQVGRNDRSFEILAPEVAEEGHLKAHTAVEQEYGAGRRHLTADEVVARWDGWSLAVSWPSFNGGAVRLQAGRHANTPFDFSFEYSVRGKLPRLRFARSYRLRARVADLAGGGLAAGDPAADRNFTGEVTYLRYEPLLSPSLALPPDAPADFGPGETVDRIVLRSDFATDPATFARENPDYRKSTVRLLLPPRTSLSLAEQHGAFDGVDAEQSWEWVEQALTATGASGEEPLLPDFAVAGVLVVPRPEPGVPVVSERPRAWTETWPTLQPKQIELREWDGRGEVLFWEADPAVGDRLVVRLPPAGQITLDLSSRLKGDLLDHFAIKGEALPADSERAVRAGRHPMVNPARSITLIHAVRRPLKAPSGRLVAIREPGQTFTLLDPQDALLGIDHSSTGQLEIVARWTDVSDGTAVLTSNVHVQSVAIDRGDFRLNDVLRHEFGDTRHRKVIYSVTATSRFRQFYDANDPGPFTVTTELPEPVTVPSSARPAPVVPVSVSPSFLWKEDPPKGDALVRRQRLSLRLRVELQGPWSLTGEGEQLAVVAWGDRRPPESLWPFLTQAARDPVFMAYFPDRFPTADRFAPSTEARPVFLPEAGTQVVAVPFNVEFANGRRFADVAMPRVPQQSSVLADPPPTFNQPSYLPFVQLALARYQPNSLPGLELSQVVRTGFAQLYPDRELTVRRSRSGVTVRLDGVTQFEQIPAAFTTVTVAVERLHAPGGRGPGGVGLSALTPPPSDVPAWVVIPSYTRHGRIGNDIEVQLPADQGPLRLRIHELDIQKEFFEEPDPGLAELNHRIVYADIVELPFT